MDAIKKAMGFGQDGGELDKKYKWGPVIGTGNFAKVYRINRKEDDKLFALKVIDKKNVQGKEEMIDIETGILKKISHSNIVSMVEMYETKDKIMLVMTLASGGELFDRIVAKGSYTENEAARLVFNMCDAIGYLHDNGIVHRDLKPENLLFSDESDEAKLMLTDFGLSKFMKEDAALSTACGTPGYVAPEVLLQNGYSKEVDLWSIGVIAYILLCGYPPFYDEDQSQLFRTIIKGKYEFHDDYWSEISDMAKDFIKKLLTVDPKKRMTAPEAMKHPWIAGEAPTTDIYGTYRSGFVKFNAKRKLRGAVMTVQMINRMKHEVK